MTFLCLLQEKFLFQMTFLSILVLYCRMLFDLGVRNNGGNYGLIKNVKQPKEAA
jgi:hypothetical protein